MQSKKKKELLKIKNVMVKIKYSIQGAGWVWAENATIFR